MLRLGLTETTLLFYYYLENILNLDLNSIKLVNSQNTLINWLYSTSGFYDKSINGTYFDIDVMKAKKSYLYNYYFSNLLRIIKEYNKNVQLCFHNIPKELNECKDKFINYLNCKNKGSPNTFNPLFIHNIIKNKRLLIINNLGILMKQQYENGNLKKLNNFPELIDIDFINPGYTWLNNKNGVELNFIVSLNKICNDIKKEIDNFDVVIISVGAYSPFILDYIYNFLKKEALVAGGELFNYFGISTKRNNPERIEKEYHIFVPDELKPLDYEKIEGGCYW